MTKVFISWSGEISHSVALTLNDWLPVMIQTVEPFISSEDLEKGGRWGKSLAQQLETTNFGVICLTPTNLQAPWINFEAGSLSKFVEESHVAPFLLQVKPSDLPETLRQFNATVAEKNDFRKLVKAINNAGGDNRIDEHRLDKSFDSCWPNIEKKLKEAEEKIKSEKDKPPTQKIGSHGLGEIDKILQELIVLSRKQTQMLTSPEALLPEAYLRHILGDDDRILASSHPVWDDLETEWRAFRRALDKNGVPSGSEVIFNAADRLAGPLEFLLDRFSRKFMRRASLFSRRRLNDKSDQVAPLVSETKVSSE